MADGTHRTRRSATDGRVRSNAADASTSGTTTGGSEHQAKRRMREEERTSGRMEEKTSKGWATSWYEMANACPRLRPWRGRPRRTGRSIGIPHVVALDGARRRRRVLAHSSANTEHRPGPAGLHGGIRTSTRRLRRPPPPTRSCRSTVASVVRPLRRASRFVRARQPKPPWRRNSLLRPFPLSNPMHRRRSLGSLGSLERESIGTEPGCDSGSKGNEGRLHRSGFDATFHVA